MPENEILAEIHSARAELSKSFGHDVKRLLAHYRELEKQFETEGHARVSFVQEGQTETLVVREDPPNAKA
jgi:hypothetical protein